MRAVYYARVSTEEQEQLDALKNQREMLEETIRNKGWDLVDFYVDEGKTGTTSNRDEFKRLWNDAKRKNFDVLVVKDFSRLSRSERDYQNFIYEMAVSEVKIYEHSKNKFFNYHDTDETTMGSMEAIFNAKYSKDLSRKTNMAHQARIKKGEIPCTNGTTWGYSQNRGDRKLTINEEEAEVVRNIFNWYVEGMGFKLIYKKLEELGIKNKNGNPFALTTLKRIIRNEKYKGWLVGNKTHKDFITKKIKQNPESEWVIHKGAIPAIVSEEIWDEANAMLNRKRKEREIKDTETIAGYWKGSYAYSGKIVCEKCGKTFWHTPYRKKHVWQCKTYKNQGVYKEDTGKGCTNIKLRQEDLDIMTRTVLTSFINNSDEIIESIISKLIKTLKTDNNQKEIDKIKVDINKLDKKLDRITDMRIDGELTKEQFMKQKDKVESDLISLNEKLNILERKSKIIESKFTRLRNMQERLKSAVVNKIDDKLLVELIDIYIGRIYVGENKNVKFVLMNKTEVNFDLDTLQEVKDYDLNMFQLGTIPGQDRYFYFS